MSFLPAYIINNPSSQRYLVNSIEGYVVSFIYGQDEVRPGVQVRFLNAALELISTGFVYKAQNNVAFSEAFEELSQSALTSIKFCELARVWNVAIPQPTQLIDDNQLFLATTGQTALLRCRCLTPPDHTGGQISWSLFRAPLDASTEYVEAIKSHDYFSVNYVRFQKQNYLWKAGVYTVIAQRYSNRGNILSEDSKTWTLKQPTNRISCGEYDDPLSSINLL